MMVHIPCSINTPLSNLQYPHLSQQITHMIGGWVAVVYAMTWRKNCKVEFSFVSSSTQPFMDYVSTLNIFVLSICFAFRRIAESFDLHT